MRELWRRLTELGLVVVLGSIPIWALILVLPGDPATAVTGEGATPEQVAAVHRELGLDEPIWMQYLTWAGRALTGQFGHSYVTGSAVSHEIGQRLLPTAQLAVIGMAIGLVIAITLSLVAAFWPKKVGWLVDGLFGIAIAVPSFWVGILLILVFSVKMGLLPSSSAYVPLWQDPVEAMRYLIMPAFTLGLFTAGYLGKFFRSSLEDVANLDYMMAARARGMTDRKAVLTHGMRNSMLPLITAFGLRAGHLLGGTVVIEVVFNYPGLGRLILEAVSRRDYLMLQGSLLVVLFIFAAVNLMVDVVYQLADPRTRRQSGRRARRPAATAST